MVILKYPLTKLASTALPNGSDVVGIIKIDVSSPAGGLKMELASISKPISFRLLELTINCSKEPCPNSLVFTIVLKLNPKSIPTTPSPATETVETLWALFITPKATSCCAAGLVPPTSSVTSIKEEGPRYFLKVCMG